MILGGGYIGMEMAQAFRRLCSEVVVIQNGPRLAPREDDDFAAAIQALFKEDGIEVALGAGDYRVEGRSGDQVAVRLSDGRSFSGSHLLVAAGRVPTTADIGLDLAGVALDTRGFINVDEKLRTTAADIWAMARPLAADVYPCGTG